MNQSAIKTAAAVLWGSLWLALAVSGISFAQENGLIERNLRVDDRSRSFWVYLPEAPRAEAGYPVVFVLHGGGGPDAETMSRRYGYNRIADREGFVVVYPYGVDGQWNDGRGRSLRPRKDIKDVDDVAYISAVIDDLERIFAIDPRRIYVTGLSNGGMMTLRLGVELGSRLAAIAAIIANLPVDIAAEKQCTPLSVLIMNGTEDPLVPWKGGQVRVFGSEVGEVLSTKETVRYWLECDGMAPEPQRVTLPDADPQDGCRIERAIYRKADRPLEVVLYTVDGGGHNVPGSVGPDFPRLVGKKCMDINASEVIWEFFKRHSRGEGKASTASEKMAD